MANTIYDAIKKMLSNEYGALDLDTDNVAKLVYIAYYIGREEATRRVSDSYTELIANMRKRAAKCRYHRMANKVIGPFNHLYFDDYSGDMTETFGSDLTDLI